MFIIVIAQRPMVFYISFSNIIENLHNLHISIIFEFTKWPINCNPDVPINNILSDNLCSLKQGTDRFAIVLDLI